MKSWAYAALAARSISSWLASGTPVRDIRPNRVVEEHGFLGHDTQGTPELPERKLPDSIAIHGDASLRHIVEAGQEVQEGGLPCAGGPTKATTDPLGP